MLEQNTVEYQFIITLVHAYDKVEDIFEVVEDLKPEHFYNPIYCEIYKVILNMIRNRDGICAATVMAKLKETDTLRMFRSNEIQLVMHPNWADETLTATPHILKLLSKVIIKDSRVRNAQALSVTVKEIKTIDDIKSVYNAMGRIVDDTSKAPFSVLVRDAIDLADRMTDPSKQEGGGWLIKTGIHPLDRAILGLKPREVLVLGGRSGMGKSTLARCIALNIANDPGQDNWVGWIGLEETVDEILGGLLIMIAGVPRDAVRDPALLTEEHKVKLAECAASIKDGRIVVDCDCYTMDDIELRARRMKAEFGIKVLVIDHIGCIQSATKNTREQEVSTLSRRIKVMGRKLDIVIISLVQLNRKPDSRDNQEPYIGDLKDSGALESDSSIVSLIWNPNLDTGGPVHIKIPKNRALGKYAEFKLPFNEQYSRFANYEDKR